MAKSTDDLFNGEASTATEVEEKVSEEKSSEETEVEVKEETTEEVKEETEAKAEEETPTEEEEKSEEAIGPDWETDDNPYKKRWHDTATWANNVHQENLRLKSKQEKALETINKKLDGTYSEEDDKTSEENERHLADFQGRLNASHQSAVSQFGEAKVTELVTGPEAPYQKLKDDPIVQVRVMYSQSPVIEAMKIADEHNFKQKYGETLEQIKENFTKELEPEIRKKVIKEYEEKLKVKERQPTTLAGARSAEHAPEKGGYKEKSADELFAQ